MDESVSLKEYAGRVLQHSVKTPWAWAGVISFVVTIVAGLVDIFNPAMSSRYMFLTWLVPLIVFVVASAWLWLTGGHHILCEETKKWEERMSTFLAEKPTRQAAAQLHIKFDPTTSLRHGGYGLRLFHLSVTVEGRGLERMQCQVLDITPMRDISDEKARRFRAFAGYSLQRRRGREIIEDQAIDLGEEAFFDIVHESIQGAIGSTVTQYGEWELQLAPEVAWEYGIPIGTYVMTIRVSGSGAMPDTIKLKLVPDSEGRLHVAEYLEESEVQEQHGLVDVSP